MDANSVIEILDRRLDDEAIFVCNVEGIVCSTQDDTAVKGNCTLQLANLLENVWLFFLSLKLFIELDHLDTTCSSITKVKLPLRV